MITKLFTLRTLVGIAALMVMQWAFTAQTAQAQDDEIRTSITMSLKGGSVTSITTDEKESVANVIWLNSPRTKVSFTVQGGEEFEYKYIVKVTKRKGIGKVQEVKTVNAPIAVASTVEIDLTEILTEGSTAMISIQEIVKISKSGASEPKTFPTKITKLAFSVQS